MYVNKEDLNEEELRKGKNAKITIKNEHWKRVFKITDNAGEKVLKFEEVE